MNKKLLVDIEMEDDAQAEALARLMAREYPYMDVYMGSREDCDYKVTNEILKEPAPVSAVAEMALKACRKDLIVDRRPGKCRFTAFTAGCGGRGCSSAALLYSRIRAGQQGLRVLLVSFDPYLNPAACAAGIEGFDGDSLIFRAAKGHRIPVKSACRRDDYGVYRFLQSSRNMLGSLTVKEIASLLEICEDGDEWDELVLDVPRACGCWSELMNMCEYKILVKDNSSPSWASDLAREELLSLPGCRENHNLYVFTVNKDEFFTFEEGDIYGQFGKEVRELAKKLAY